MESGWRPITSISIALIFCCAAFFLVFPVVIAPRFAALFKDFGSELPLITRLALSPWAAFFALACLGVGVTAGILRPRERAIVLSLTAGGGISGVFAAVTALYLPIFELAGKIK